MGSWLLKSFRLPAQGDQQPAECGSAVVEFAMSATILLTLVFGIIGMSWAIYAYHYISNAAREGTRYAIVRGSTCSPAFIGDCPADGTGADVQTYLRNHVFPGINPNKMTVTTTWPGTGPSCTPSANPCDNPGNPVQVTVTYQFPLLIPFVPAETLTMHSSSQMVISQ